MTKSLTAAERRTEAVSTVLELAAEKPPSDITTNDIAHRMGVSQSALFRHFSTKDHIRQSVMQWVTEQLLARIEKAAQKHDSPIASLEAMFQSHITFITKYPGVPRMIFGELQKSGDSLPRQIVCLLIAEYSTRLQTLLEVGRAKGELDPELDPEAAAVAFIGMIQGLVVRSLIAGDPGLVRREAAPVFALYLRGIRI